jgi:hypothetical protein
MQGCSIWIVKGFSCSVKNIYSATSDQQNSIFLNFKFFLHQNFESGLTDSEKSQNPDKELKILI